MKERTIKEISKMLKERVTVSRGHRVIEGYIIEFCRDTFEFVIWGTLGSTEPEFKSMSRIRDYFHINDYTFRTIDKSEIEEKHFFVKPYPYHRKGISL